MKLSVKEYMKSRNVSRRTIYNRINSGKLEIIKENNKTYIVKENLNRPVRKSVTQIISADFLNVERLNEIKESILLLQNSYNILKEFDYNFLRDRLSSIEKSLINFVIDVNKSNEKINNKTDKFTVDILHKIEELGNRNNAFLENFLLINEQNNIFFKEELEKIENRFENIEEKLKNIKLLEDKFNELIKVLDSKKSFGLFKK